MNLLIKQFEGFSEVAYYCPAGKLTIGYGNTFYKDGTMVKQGDTITKTEAEDLLDWYCRECITLPKGNFSAEQREALYSLIFNIGQSAFDKSKCKKAIEKKDWEEAYKQWDWTKANGKELKGLVKRRNAEKKLFFKNIVLDIPF
jgi:lysozyme